MTSFAKSVIAFSWAARIVLTLLPQHGYIHPDEFFQFTEPFIGEILGIKKSLAWEFTTDQPVRSVFFPLLINSPFFILKKWFSPWLTSYIIMVFPRLIFTGLSFITDLCLYKISELTLGWRWTLPSLVFSTSYLTLSYMTHSFNNSLETILVSLVLWIVISSLVVKRTKHHTLLGILSALGIFNRPTFPVFTAIPLIFWLSIGQGSFPSRQLANGLKSLPWFVATCITMVLIDTAYYRRDTFDHAFEFLSGDLKLTQFINKISLVITPWNFINYNRKTENLENHGLHDPYHHMLVNVPLAFGLLGLMAYVEIIRISFSPFRYKMIPARKIILLTFWVSLVTLSFIPHQEPRFLLPCLFFLAYLYSEKFRVRRFMLVCWIITNIALTYIYGFVHQAGVTKALFQINHDITLDKLSQFDIIFSRTYLPPQTLLNIPKENNRVIFHDLSILEFPEAVINKLKELEKLDNKKNVILVQPSSLSWYLDKLTEDWGNITFSVKHSYFPHFTHEDLEASAQHMLANADREDRYELIKEAFSLEIYEVFFKKKENG